ncbi:MAG: hypothetical protein JSV38_11245 [Desulfobacterales bacterium]|nr:MAG: hypothetical protein JSV38_11245 [Desulfobacterales bacterium]
MANMKDIIERRKHRRFQARRGTFAALNNGSLKIGQIQNISKGGLAFRYIANEGQAEGSNNVDIFVTDNDFLLRKIPFTTVSDDSLDLEIPFSTVSLRQCCGQFGELTQTQQSELDHFIKGYTVS